MVIIDEAGMADHPRLRGVHFLVIVSMIVPSGSSPLTRGALWRDPGAHGGDGIIPAYAGCTSGDA